MNVLLNNKFFVIYFAPFLLGILTIFSFSPYNLSLINFFTFSFLLSLILIVKKKTQTNYRKKKSYRYFFLMGCAFGFGFFLFGNYWISISLTHDEQFKNLIFFSLILIPLFLSFFFGIAVLIIGPFSEKSISFVLLFSLIFSLLEFLRGNILTGFPWNLISYTWSWSPELIQILSLLGTYTLSIFSITLFCLIFLFFQNKILKKNIFFLFILLSAFIFNYLYGVTKMSSSDYQFDKKVYIKVVSPSFSLKDYSLNSEISQINRLITISNPQKKQKTIFIWPEGIFYESNLDDLRKYQDLFLQSFSEKHLIILGVNNFKKNKYFNNLVVFNNKLEVLSSYNKVNLVPFGEYLPFEKILSRFGFKKITQGYNSFSPGNERPLINLGDGFENKLALPLICYEIIYPGKIKNKKQFPDIVVNISEDAWFGDSIGPHQHFTKAIYRSVEEGVFVARAANKGISAFINPNGKIIKSLNTGESGNIELNFPSFYQQTLFSKYGNKIFYLIIFLYMFLILIFRKFRI